MTGDLAFVAGKKVDNVDISEFIASWAGTPSGQVKYYTIKALFIEGTLSAGIVTVNLSTPFTSAVVFVQEKKAATSTEVFTYEIVSSTQIKIRSSNTASTTTVGVMVFGI